MKNCLIKLLTGVIVLFTLQSYSSHKEKRESENGRFVDTHNRQVNTQHVDSIDIIQLVKDRWLQIVSPDCIDTLAFKQDGTYKQDNSELNYYFQGKYTTSKDTIF
ncbi:MAG: hypothetical protein LBK03_01775, partial [Bacteroidales bacterium]|nr:hypothetical protein [Bacteroidales bacterium]